MIESRDVHETLRRYQLVDGFDLVVDLSPPLQGDLIRRLDSEYDAHQLLFGLRLNF